MMRKVARERNQALYNRHAAFAADQMLARRQMQHVIADGRGNAFKIKSMLNHGKPIATARSKSNQIESETFAKQFHPQHFLRAR